MMSSYKIFPSYFDREKTSGFLGTSSAVGWSFFLREMKNIPKKIYRRTAPSRGNTIRNTLRPEVEFSLSTTAWLQGSSPSTFPHNPLLPSNASFAAFWNAVLLGIGPSNLLQEMSTSSKPSKLEPYRPWRDLARSGVLRHLNSVMPLISRFQDWCPSPFVLEWWADYKSR